MKRMKFLLTALAVFSIVGTGLAFKAYKSNSPVFCSNSAGTACIFPNWRQNLIDGAVTTTEPCGAGINYYITNAQNCAANPVAPASTLVLYQTVNM